MKTARSCRALALVLLIFAGAMVFTTCASFTPYEESVLIEAGFSPVSTSMSAAYAALPAYKVLPIHGPNDADYAYRNEAKGLTYLGSKAEYQRYQELIQQKGAERIDRVNRQMNQDSLHGFR
jgi:hypothetical protein